MKLYLAVPRQSRQTDAQTVTRPAQTREWIARLPLLNTRESLQQIHNALWGINRTELKTGQRLKLLDMYRSPLQVIRRQVETRLTRGAAPLSDADLTIAEAFRNCCVEMACGYKTIVLEVAQTRKRRQLDELRLSMARAIFYLEQAVFACALYRQTPPESVWLEIHTIYQYAVQLGIAENPIRDPIARARTATSISLTYRRALLFGLSDPFHQSVSVMGRLLNFIRRHAQDAVLKAYSPPPTERCQFVIDPMSDYPARAYVKQGDEEPPGNALLLDTLQLTRSAHDQLKRLTSAAQYDVELDDEFQDELGRKLLEEVVYAWGMIPRREEERTEGEEDIELMIGIGAVAHCMNGGKQLELSSTDHASHAATAGTFQLHQVRRQASTPEPVGGRVVDKAASGIRIAVPYNAAAVGSLRVGDIIAVRESAGAWTPGLIRWIRCVDDAIHLGVRKLQRPSRPVAVKPVATEGEVPFKEGLALFPDDEEAAIQLITPPGLYRQQRNLFIDDGSSLLMTRSRGLLERSQTMEWFECDKIKL